MLSAKQINQQLSKLRVGDERGVHPSVKTLFESQTTELGGLEAFGKNWTINKNNPREVVALVEVEAKEQSSQEEGTTESDDHNDDEFKID